MRPPPHILGATAHALIALALTVAAWWLYMLNGRYIGSGDTYPAQLMPISILREGDLDFNEFGDDLEKGYMFVRVNERVISFYPIVPGLLNVPAYWLADGDGVDLHAEQTKLSKLTAAMVCALSVGLMYVAVLGVSERGWTPLVITALYATATATWSVASTAMWQHGPSLLFLAGGMACLAWRPTWLVALGGVCFGMATWNRPTNGLFLATAGLFVLIHRRRTLPGFVVLALVPLTLMSWYSLTHWDSLLALGQGHKFMPHVHPPHRTHFNAPLVEHLAGLLVSPGRGLLVFSPIFVLSLAAMLHLTARPRGHALTWWMGLGAIAHLVLHAKWNIWWGGWSFGYRLLIEMIPALTLLLAAGWEQWVVPRPWRLGQAWRVAAFAPLAAASIYIHYLGAFEYPSGFNGTPDNIDHNPRRLWHVRDTELIRLHDKALKP